LEVALSDVLNVARNQEQSVILDSPKTAAFTTTQVTDAFEKAYAFTRADEAEAAGMHPYFKPIAEQHGGEVVVNGRTMVISGSNDYLGLTQDERLKDAARDALNYFGTSCTGSRFLTGTLTLHEDLEQRLATFLGKESALTFSAGFLGCLSVISALTGRHDILYFDRENHACLYDGARLSYGTLRKYEHNDLDDLERLLERDTDKPGGRMIVTDGVFSMSGHIANLPRIVQIARKYGARIIVDEAHATGVLGDHGRGTPNHFGLDNEIDIIVGTFSKSFASVGGFMAGPRAVVNFVKHKARPFIFTAALPAMQMAAALKALEIMESEPQHQVQLWDNIHYYKNKMNALGFNTLGSESAIVPVLIGDDDTALMFWKGLWEEDIFTTPSVSPGVPPGEAIIRTSVNANHTREQLDKLLHAFEVVGKRLGIIS
jgi:8-amino-7-oxononanoate synthase